MKHTQHSFRSQPRLALTLALALAAGFLTAVPARAATLYWDTDGATAGFGTASGTWAAPTPGPTVGWSTDSTGASAIASVTTGSDNLNFGTDTVGVASGTITLSGTVSAANLRFGKASGDITLTGGTISIGGGNNVIQASSSGGSVSNTHTIDSDITKTSGTLQFGTQGTTNEHYIVNGNLGGGFALNPRMVNNTGLLELNGLNSFTGNVAITTGQVNANSFADSATASALGAGSAISMGGGGGQQPRLVYTGAAANSTNRTVTINTASGGAGGIIAQNGALDLSGTIQASGSNLDNLLVLSGTADTGTNTVSGTITNGSGGGELDVRIQSLSAVGVTGEAGNWIFSGANTYTGTTQIQNSSTLQLGDGGTTGSLSTSSAITVNAGSTFVVNQSDTPTQGTDFSDTLNGSGNVTMAGSGTLVLKIKGGWSGNTTVDSGTLRLENTADLVGMTSDDFFINNGSTLEIESSVGGNNRSTLLNDSIFTFDSNGGGNIDFVSGNHLAQTGTSGTARFVTTGGSQNTITSSGGFINPQGSGNHVTFDVADGTDDVDLAVSVTISNGTWRKDGAGTLSITGSNSSVASGGAININDGTFEIGGNGQIRSTGQAGGSGIVTTAINNEGIFKHNTTLDQTVQSVISGTGALVKDNTGTLTLTGANIYTGATSVDAGQLSLEGSLTSTVTVASGAILATETATVASTTGDIDLLTGSIGEFTLFSDPAGAGTAGIDHSAWMADNFDFGDITIHFLEDTDDLGLTLDLDDEFKLIDWDTAFTLSGTTTFSMLPTLSAGLNWDTTSRWGSEGVIQIIPEPSRALLLMFGAMGVILHRRRPRRAAGN